MHRDEERSFAIGHHQQRLEAAQHAISSPIFRQLHRGAAQHAIVFLQLALEFVEQRDRIGNRARKSGEHLVVVQATHLLGSLLHDGRIAHRDLAVAGDHYMARVRETKYIVVP